MNARNSILPPETLECQEKSAFGQPAANRGVLLSSEWAANNTGNSETDGTFSLEPYVTATYTAL